MPLEILHRAAPCRNVPVTFTLDRTVTGMTYYCTLFLRSDQKDAPAVVLLPRAMEALEFEDNHSPESLARAARLRTVGFITRSDLPRYSWTLDTQSEVGTEETDLFVHVSWLMSQLRPKVLLGDLAKVGIEPLLSFFWSGNGTGGGPFIQPELSELLGRHRIGFNIGFYYAEAEGAV